VVDGLTGLPEAIGTVFAQTTVQTPDQVGGRRCIVHLIRNSLALLIRFAAQPWRGSPAIGPSWRRAWEHVVPMFAFPPAIRKMIYTAGALESLHRSLRKIIKPRGSFPSDEAAIKLSFLAIRNAGVHWRRPIEWTAAMGQFAILFEDRFPASAR
jgi:putative transposase